MQLFQKSLGGVVGVHVICSFLGRLCKVLLEFLSLGVMFNHLLLLDGRLFATILDHDFLKLD